mgnify:CR=1 FL=1
MQTTFSRESRVGFVGTLAYARGIKEILSKVANQAIEFGRKMSYVTADKKAVDTIGTNKVVLTNSANLDASDTYSFTLKIKNTSTGTETSNAITTTFSASDAVTMGTIVTAVEALTGISSSTAYASNVLTIIASTGYTIEVSSEATGGGSTVTIAKANYDTRLAAGISGFIDKESFDDGSGNTISRYKVNEIVKDIVRSSGVVVESATGFDGDDTLYWVGYGTHRGKLSNVVGDNGILATGVTHRETATAGGKGVVSIDI